MEETMTLYHGSSVMVRTPCLDRCRSNNDYGRAFYCTREFAMAGEWACGLDCDGFVNAYTLPLKTLHVLDLNSSEYCILHWLSVLVAHRSFDMDLSPLRQAAHWLQANFEVDLTQADVVKGYRADDSYFSFAREFLKNTLTLDQLNHAMHLGKLGEQYALRSEQAVSLLELDESVPVLSRDYWPKRQERDRKARQEFRDMLAYGLAEGDRDIHVVDLMRMKEGELYDALF